MTLYVLDGIMLSVRNPMLQICAGPKEMGPCISEQPCQCLDAQALFTLMLITYSYFFKNIYDNLIIT